jgi:hypothetical protein
VQEYADVGISVKGSFYPPNKEPKDGERKLFLFIEARSELALARAKTEVIRIMKDSLRQLVNYPNFSFIIYKWIFSGVASVKGWSNESVQSGLIMIVVVGRGDRYIAHCYCFCVQRAIDALRVVIDRACVLRCNKRFGVRPLPLAGLCSVGCNLHGLRPPAANTCAAFLFTLGT